MGAWGMGSFENDSALDWLFELDTATDDTPIADAFAAVRADEYFEVDEGSAAVAAAEVVAALLGHPARRLPERLSSWVNALNPVQASAWGERQRGAALKALQDVRDVSRSELAELWAETDNHATWIAALDELSERINTL